ncbi:hypothetical protein O181_010340 [Austropuccinia psidii MF-1]|uniref:Uncharacterized protein n=1 Tax=Austropuccinia psidii MF-1 TaxID=1389203 RepID=A0A9Q3BTP0_9BASI|nr:hypothetical protein [Austropuccinia psidii MF-1]
MFQALLKQVPKLKEWPHFSGEGEYDNMEFIRGIEMIKEDSELPDRLVAAIFNTLFTRSAHRWYIKLRQAHGHQSWTLWKTQIINKWANDAWRFEVETSFESSKFNADKDKALPWFFHQKDRLTALYPDMSEFMIHRKILTQCGAEDILNILEEVTTRTRAGFSRVNLKTKLNTPWKDSVEKNPKENSNNIKYKFVDLMRKCHICHSTTHLANTCTKKGKRSEIDIEKEPDVEKAEVNEDNSDSESSKDIENINATSDIMESYSHLPQLINSQLDLSRIQDAQLMKTQPNRGKGHTSGKSCITEVVVDKKPTKLSLDPGAFCSCVGKSLLKTCVPKFEDKLSPIDGIKFDSASSPMKALGVLDTTDICSSTHFILGNDYLMMYGLYLHNNKDRYIDIGDNNNQRFAFLQFKRQITVNKLSPVSLELETFKSKQLNESEISPNLSDKQESELSALLYEHKEAFASDKEPLGAIVGHDVDIILNIERPYAPLLRRPAYPASPK